MQAFHNDITVKNNILAQLQRHADADEIIRGTGWDGHRGCAIGCLLHKYDHSLLPDRLGWPEWFGRVVDTLHEGVSLNKNWDKGTWVQAVTDAVPIGLTERQFELQIKAPFLVTVLESTLATIDHSKYPDVKKAIDDSIALWKREDIGGAAWNKAAERAAGVEARATERAAWAAAWAARAAARAAESAAWTAVAAEAAVATEAAGPAKYDYFADELLKLLRNANVKG